MTYPVIPDVPVGVFAVADPTTSSQKQAVGVAGDAHITDGGTTVLSVTASSTAAVTTGVHRLCRVIPLTTVTASVSLFDSTTQAAGTVLAIIPASAAIGGVYNVQCPVSTGIYVGGGAGTPGLTVIYE